MTVPLSARNIHLAVMSLTGLVLGLLVVTRPSFGRGIMFPFFVLVLVSLVADVGIAMLSNRRRVTPLSINARLGGFLSGAVLYLAITWAFTAGTIHV